MTFHRFKILFHHAPEPDKQLGAISGIQHWTINGVTGTVAIGDALIGEIAMDTVSEVVFNSFGPYPASTADHAEISSIYSVIGGYQ
jgi:hypothetical protein